MDVPHRHGNVGVPSEPLDDRDPDAPFSEPRDGRVSQVVKAGPLKAGLPRPDREPLREVVRTERTAGVTEHEVVGVEPHLYPGPPLGTEAEQDVEDRTRERGHEG